jgi:hypothetical protein
VTGREFPHSCRGPSLLGIAASHVEGENALRAKSQYDGASFAAHPVSEAPDLAFHCQDQQMHWCMVHKHWSYGGRDQLELTILRLEDSSMTDYDPRLVSAICHQRHLQPVVGHEAQAGWPKPDGQSFLDQSIDLETVRVDERSVLLGCPRFVLWPLLRLRSLRIRFGGA